ncbi:unnamed protein product, partial [Callosobruchus maculatus]
SNCYIVRKTTLKEGCIVRWYSYGTSRPIPVPHSFAKMPSHHKCAVKDCQDRISVRHRFPNPGKFITVFRQWINCIGNEAISHLEPVAVYNNYRVCHAHFTEDDTYTNNRLKKTAVPSVNLPEPQICQMVKANWYVIILYLLLVLRILLD